MIHSALAHPDSSWLRKMSENTLISKKIQMKKQKNQSIDQNTCPVPKSESSAVIVRVDMEVLSSGCPRLSSRSCRTLVLAGRHHRRTICRGFALAARGDRPYARRGRAINAAVGPRQP